MNHTIRASEDSQIRLTLYPMSWNLLAVSRNLGWNESWIPIRMLPLGFGNLKPVDIRAFKNAEFTVDPKQATYNTALSHYILSSPQH